MPSWPEANIRVGNLLVWDAHYRGSAGVKWFQLPIAVGRVADYIGQVSCNEKYLAYVRSARAGGYSIVLDGEGTIGIEMTTNDFRTIGELSKQ